LSIGEGAKRRQRPLLARPGVIAVALLGGAAGTLYAALPVSQGFRVTVTLSAPAESETAQCGSTVEPGAGRKITLNCSSSHSVGDIPRYLLHVYRAGEWLGTVDGQMGTGTVTSWRVVHVANREYLEMTVGW
jgi:hypothetical protein